MEMATPEQRRKATKWLLSFVCLLAFGMNERSSTIKKALMAIRFFHLAHDYENPLSKCLRVWQGYTAAKRSQGPTVRKHPVTPETCDWLDRAQRRRGSLESSAGPIATSASTWAVAAASTSDPSDID